MCIAFQLLECCAQDVSPLRCLSCRFIQAPGPTAWPSVAVLGRAPACLPLLVQPGLAPACSFKIVSVHPSFAFCKSLWCWGRCPKTSVALGAGIGLLDGSLRKWRSANTPDRIPKLPAQATHLGMAGIGKVALRQLWPRVRHRFSWHCLCFFIAKYPWSARRRRVLRHGSLKKQIRQSIQGLVLFGCMCAGTSTATHLPRPCGDRCQRQRASASHFGSTPLCRR